MPKIYEQNGRPFVWNADDAHELRSKHRIIGSLVGCYPKQPFQNSYKYLPMLLMPEEAKVAVEKGFAEIFSFSSEKVADSEIIQNYWKRRKELCNQQINKLKVARRKTILEKADLICEGKRQKLSGQESIRKKKIRTLSNKDEYASNSTPSSIKKKMEMDDPTNIEISEENFKNSSPNDKEKLCVESPNHSNLVSISDEAKQAFIEKEIEKTSNISEDNCLVQLFTECPWKSDDLSSRSWSFPQTNHERLRYAVFKDLWEKGYYLTCGTKFGGDFLVYSGDPVKFHALFIVLCIDEEQTFQPMDLVMYGRLGNQVKKTAVVATMNFDGAVNYFSFTWASDFCD